MISEADKRTEEALGRQADPGQYALLHANGMSFRLLVTLISEDAIAVEYYQARG